MASDEQWHLVEARRDDGAPAIFRIRDLEPRLDQPRIFVVEAPYPAIALSGLPDAAGYRRLAQFEEDWISPACAALGWTFVAAKTEDGACFFYLYGAADPQALIARLSPFDGALVFFDEEDPTWQEYGTLKELLEEANAMPPEATEADADADPADDQPADDAPGEDEAEDEDADARRTTRFKPLPADQPEPAPSRSSAKPTEPARPKAKARPSVVTAKPAKIKAKAKPAKIKAKAKPAKVKAKAKPAKVKAKAKAKPAKPKATRTKTKAKSTKAKATKAKSRS